MKIVRIPKDAAIVKFTNISKNMHLIYSKKRKRAIDVIPGRSFVLYDLTVNKTSICALGDLYMSDNILVSTAINQ